MTLSPKDRMKLSDFVTGSGRWMGRRAERADAMVAIHREVLVLLARVVLQLDRGIEQRLDRIEARFRAPGRAS